MSEEMGMRLGKAMVEFCRQQGKKPKVLIGRDTRESGALLSQAVVDGISLSGGEAVLAGIIPTPGTAFLTKAGDFSLGLVISASHNDCTYNGFKFFNSEGDKLNDKEEEIIEELIDAHGGQSKGERRYAGARKMEEALKKYESGLLSALPKNFTLKGLKIVLDCAEGAACEIAPQVFKKIGAEVIACFNQPDGKNINSNCGSQFPEKMAEEVLKNKAHLGLAFDGDGDRVIASDEKGRILNGDELIYIFAKMLKEKGELGSAVVSTVMSNLGFANAIKKMGVKHVYTGVGDQRVFEKMKEIGAVLGGEESGHIIFRNFLSSGDGIFCGLKLAEAMGYFKKSLSCLGEGIVFYPKILINAKVKSKPELSTVEEIDKVIKEAEEHFGDNGRVVVRYSGTESLCRIMIEGENENEVKGYSDKIAKVIERELN